MMLPINRTLLMRLRGRSGPFFQEVRPNLFMKSAFRSAAELLFSWSPQSTPELPAGAVFTRATTATVESSGSTVIDDALAGEARFGGARRERNLATALTTHAVTVVAGRSYQASINGAAGATAVFSGAFTGTLTANGTNRISWPNGTPQSATTASVTVTVTGALTELLVQDVTGRSNQVPSENVAFDVSYGANVNGVRYFGYQNANTVDVSGVITEAQGAALSGIAYLDEPASTNLQTKSECEDGDGWVSFNATLTNLSLNALGRFPGVQVASTGTQFGYVRPDSANLIAVTSGMAYNFTWWYRAGTSGQVRVNLRNNTTAETSVLAGLVGNIAIDNETAGTFSSIQNKNLGGSDYLCQFTFTPNGTSDYQNRLGHNSAVVGETVVALGAQIELSSYPTSYIPTDTVAVTRNADSLNLSGVAGYSANNQTRVNVDTLPLDGMYADSDNGNWNGSVSEEGMIRSIDHWTRFPP